MDIGIYCKDVKIDLYDLKPCTLLNFEILKFYDKYKNKDLRLYIGKIELNFRRKKKLKRKLKLMKIDFVTFLNF